MNALPSFRTRALPEAMNLLARTLVRGVRVRDAEAVADLDEAFASACVSARATDHLATDVEVHRRDLDALLSSKGAFVVAPLPERDVVYVVVAGGAKPTLLAPDGSLVVVSRAALAAAIGQGAEARTSRMCQRVLGALGPAVDARRLRDAVVAELDQSSPLARALVLRENVSSFDTLAQKLGPGRSLARLVALAIAQTLLLIGSWWLIGSLALEGRSDLGNLLGWTLVVVTAALVQLVATSATGKVTLRAASLLRERLLDNTLALDPDRLGAHGLGGLTVMSAQADGFLGGILALTLATLTLLVNLVATVAVLSAANGAALFLGIFGVAALVILLLAPFLVKALTAQQKLRLDLTTDTVERMLGHRTRLVQETANAWHEGEDESVHGYGEGAKRSDRLVLALRAVPRVYYLASIAALFVVLVGPKTTALAAMLGGMALGALTLGALAEVVLAGSTLTALARSLAPLMHGKPRDRALVGETSPSTTEAPVVELRGVRYAHPARARRVFDDATLTIKTGDRVLVEGPSGGGKTTLASLITGLRPPDAGLVLVRGVDQFSLGELDLRRSIASAPQFYKNHLFTGTLAYNLLLSRAWPPSPADLEAAESVARELGLGPLLDRMPAGLFQHVGATGWQLSHGEKSRVFLARTLLQRAPLVVLDETFGALDPHALRQAMRVAEERAPTLMVVTHR